MKYKQVHMNSFFSGGIYHTCQKQKHAVQRKMLPEFPVACCCVKYGYVSISFIQYSVYIVHTYTELRNCEAEESVLPARWLVTINQTKFPTLKN